MFLKEKHIWTHLNLLICSPTRLCEKRASCVCVCLASSSSSSCCHFPFGGVYLSGPEWESQWALPQEHIAPRPRAGGEGELIALLAVKPPHVACIRPDKALGDVFMLFLFIYLCDIRWREGSAPCVMNTAAMRWDEMRWASERFGLNETRPDQNGWLPSSFSRPKPCTSDGNVVTSCSRCPRGAGSRFRDEQRLEERPGLQYSCPEDAESPLPLFPRQSARVGAQEQSVRGSAAARTGRGTMQELFKPWASCANRVPAPVRRPASRGEGPGQRLELLPWQEGCRSPGAPSGARGFMDAPGWSRGPDRHHHPWAEGHLQRVG